MTNTDVGKNPGSGTPAKAAPSVGDMRPAAIAAIVLYYIVIYGCLIFLQLALWIGYSASGTSELNLYWLGDYHLSSDAWYLDQVLSLGALGSFVHATTSLADFVGNKQAEKSWGTWYILRPFIGSALALVFYLVVRGGLLSTTVDSKSLNVYGFMGISALAGMFSKQATNKLSELFDTLFKTAPGAGDDARKNPLTPTPGSPTGAPTPPAGPTAGSSQTGTTNPNG